MIEIVKLLKDEDTCSKTEESLTSSISYQTTAMASFKRTCLVVEQYSEDSTSNEGTLYVNGCEEEVSRRIFEIRRDEAFTNK